MWAINCNGGVIEASPFNIVVCAVTPTLWFKVIGAKPFSVEFYCLSDYMCARDAGRTVKGIVVSENRKNRIECLISNYKGLC